MRSLTAADSAMRLISRAVWYRSHVTRAELHQIVDELPEASVEVAGQLLRRAVEEPEVAQLLMAPWDDEPVSETEQAAIREALKEPGIPLERVRKELLD
jgi:hypothetical protein